MLHCCACNSLETFSFNDFKIHINNVHKYLSVFTCHMCRKDFQSKKSFFKHINKNSVCSASITTIENEIENNIEPNSFSMLTNSNVINANMIEENKRDNQPAIDSIQQCDINIESNILSVFSDLYADYGLSRKDSERIISKFTSMLIVPILKNLEDYIEPLVKGTDKIKLVSKIQDIINSFQKFGSFHLYLKFIEQEGFYEAPKNIEISNTIGPVIKGNKSSMDEIKINETLMPLEHQFQRFFELPGVLKLTLDSMKESDDSGDYISSIINSESWKKKVANREGNFIAYNLYFDELQIDNPLGSHSGDHSLSSLYYNFPTLPKLYSSLLKNIFVAMVYESRNKTCGNGIIFQKLIDGMNFLNLNGLEFTMNDEQIRVHFIMHIVTGDNSGLNMILGFSRSPAANFYCRNCSCHRCECQSLSREDESKLRTKLKYEQDLLLDTDNDKRSKLCGIRENSIFNQIESFHVTENYVLDIMHDLFEGVCEYVTSQCLFQLIQTKCTTLSLINSRKESFKYDISDQGNITGLLNIKHLSEKKINMNAREMWTFCHSLPLMIGDLISEGNLYWKQICLLIEMMDLLLLPKFNDQALTLLSNKIATHHEHYKTLFGNQSLTPKFHNLVHYPTVIKKIGPPKSFWCMRFEAKHRQIKEYTKNINSRINIAKSVGIKCSLNFANRIIENKGLMGSIKSSKFKTRDSIINKFYYHLLPNENDTQIQNPNEEYNFFSSIEYVGITYKIDAFITKTVSFNSKLFKIVDIIVMQESVFFVVQEYEVGDFSFHFQSFKVLDSSERYTVSSLEDFDGPPINTHKLSNSDIYFRLKFF